MNRKNIGKVLGIAGLVIVGKSQLLALLNNQKKDGEIQVISIQPESNLNLTEKAFDFVGTPQLRISSFSSTSSTVVGIGVSLVPSVVDVDFS